MPFHEELLHATEPARREFLAIPTLVRGTHGEISRDAYLGFLNRAYHHVRHTVPLLMACGARLPMRLDWLRDAVVHYIQEEAGHEQWILDDIRACGGDADATRRGEPDPSADIMVAYAYDSVARRNPLALFGMILVLEGTSVQLATRAAAAIQEKLGLPGNAFRYLRSHGALDQDHIRYFHGLVDRIDESEDRGAVCRAASMFYRLYGDVFRSIPV